MLIGSFFILGVIMAIVIGWECGGTRDDIHQGPPSQSNLLTRSSNLAPIRLSPYYLDFNLGSPDLNYYFKYTLFPYVDGFFKSRLKVYSVSQKIVLSYETCQGFSMPSEHMTIGVSDTDVIIYIMSETNSRVNSIAYAGACELDISNKNNVISGLLMINTYLFNSQVFAGQYSILIHEIYHILGFSSGLYSFWKDQNGNEYIQPTEMTSVRGLTKAILKTPNVVAKAKEAFGCDSLTGIELEDYGSEGLAGSHWDMRIMFNDFMIGKEIFDPIYSTISLALMKDTGWYEVNYTKADVPYFGRGVGCSFFENECLTNEISNFPNLFCDTSDSSICDTFALRKGYCGSMNRKTDYYSSFRLEGDSYADNCPIRVGYDRGDCRASNPDETIIDEDTQEFISPISRCFISTLSVDFVLFEGSACYEVLSCSEIAAKVRVGPRIIECPFTGGSFSVKGFIGEITCPASKILCENYPCIEGCRGLGVCINGVCNCDPGYSGNSCEYMCDATCSKCDLQTCLVCKDSNAIANGKTCACKSGFFQNSAGVCDPCDPTCSQCNIISCLVCKDSNAVVNQKSCACKSGFFLSADWSCFMSKCNSLCLKCNSGLCLICTENASINNQVCSCNPGFFISGSACMPCDTECLVCSADACSLCKDSNAETSGKTCACKSGYIKDMNGICSFACNSLCISCKNKICLECKINSVLYNGGCSCAKGFQLNINLCTLCGSFCTSCSEGRCLTCSPRSILSNGACVCAPGFTNSSFGCLACPDGCYSCLISSFCTKCKDGFYKLASGTCVACSNSCSQCTSSGCSSCFAGFELNFGSCTKRCDNNCKTCSSTGICSECKLKFFLSENNCISCTINCDQCSDSTKCTTCSSGFTLLSTGLCGFSCSSLCSGCNSTTGKCFTCLTGYYIDSTGKCKACKKECEDCTSTQCLSCKVGYTLSEGRCKLNCSPKCIKCSSSTKCTRCKSGYTLSITGTCSVSCPRNCSKCNSLGSCYLCNSGYYISSGKCSKCAEGCLECSSAKVCTVCNDGYYLSISKICTKCSDINCFMCNQAQCESCKPGYSIKAGKCEKNNI